MRAWRWLALAAAAACVGGGSAAAARDGAALEVVSVRAATHRELGLLTGKARYASLRAFFKAPNGSLASTLRPFYASKEGKEVVEQLLASSRLAFPGYVAELEGLAEAIEVDFMDVFLQNAESEVDLAVAARDAAAQNECCRLCLLCRAARWWRAVAGAGAPPATAVAPPRDAHCTDLLATGSQLGERWLAHNEDYDPEMIGHVFLLNATVAESKEHFVALVYPGSLPGWAFGFNRHGVAVSANSVFPKRLAAKGGVPVSFAARLALSARSAAQAAQAMAKLPGDAVPFGGLSLNVGDTAARGLLNVELSSASTSQRYLSDRLSVFWHVNQYVHNEMRADEAPDPSSAARDAEIRKRVAQDPGLPFSPQGLLDLLGDTENPTYPIFRAGNKDDIFTLATALFDFKRAELRVWDRCNPRFCEHSFAFPMPRPGEQADSADLALM